MFGLLTVTSDMGTEGDPVVYHLISTGSLGMISLHDIVQSLKKITRISQGSALKPLGWYMRILELDTS